MASEGKAHLLVAIDFGMTCTGVAYLNLSTGSKSVRVLQKWPGRAHHNESKVPSILVYPRAVGTQLSLEPSAWGFLAETHHDQFPNESELREWFKVLLDENQLAQQRAKIPDQWPHSISEVEKYYEDYLRLVYGRIKAEIGPQINGPSWEDATVEFVFSLPTTWKDKTTVERFRAAIQRAGYGSCPRHSVTIGLTEAEAAAVFTSKEDIGMFNAGDVICVCDAGGGTTVSFSDGDLAGVPLIQMRKDLAVLKVQSIQDGVMVLRQLDVVQGKSIGSVQIDMEFSRLVEARLQQASQIQALALNGYELVDAAYEAMKSSDYQTMKCEFGSEATRSYQSFSIPVKRLPWNYINRQCGIWEQCIHVSQQDFEILFTTQTRKLYDLIDSQLGRLQQKYPNEAITHLVLSGGLGNSEYVRSKLIERYERGGMTNFQNILKLRVRTAPEPQLAVCKGILEDRLQKLSSGKSIMGWRCCRESYGVGCRQIYDPKNTEHFHRRKTVDPIDGKTYVDDGVEWFVKAGDAVSSETPISRNFFRTIQLGDTNRQFGTVVYVCYAQDPTYLPNYTNKDVKKAATIQSSFQQFDLDQFEKRKKSCMSKGKTHFLVRYVIKAIVGPGDLRFELWFKDRKVNSDNALKVEWHPTSAPQHRPDQPTPGVLYGY